jgi:O-antigen/teichoic acid export membrane protein
MVFWVMTFLGLLGLFLGGFLTDATTRAVEQNELTGIEAFILNNLILVVIIAMIIFILAFTYLGGGT